MDRELYNSKLTTPGYVASLVKSGEHVYIGHTSSIAYALAEALMDREDEVLDFHGERVKPDVRLAAYPLDTDWLTK